MLPLNQELEKQFLFLERVKSDTLELITTNLQVAKKRILAGMGNNESEIRALVKREIKGAFDGFEDSLLTDIEDITATTWNVTGVLMAKYLTDNLSSNFKKFENVDDIIKRRLLNPKQLILGNNLEDYKNNFIYNANTKLRTAVLQGIKSKVGIDEITRQADGVIGNLARNQLRTVIRTATLSAINEAKGEQFQQMLKGDSGIIYYYNSVMDTRTSKPCFELNNTASFDIDTIKNLLNFHYNCRSLLGVTSKGIREFESKNIPKDRFAQWEEYRMSPIKSKNKLEKDGTTMQGKYRIGKSKAIYDTKQQALDAYREENGTIPTKFKLDGVKTVSRNASSETYFKAFDKEYQIKYAGKKNYQLWRDNKISFDAMMGVSLNSLIPKNAKVFNI